MKNTVRIPCFCGAIFTAAFSLFSASAAGESWLYDSSTKTMTCGSVVLSNVTAMTNNRLSIGGNAGNPSAINVNLSLPVYTASGTNYVIDTLEQGAFYKGTIITNVVLGEGLRIMCRGVFEGASKLSGTTPLPSTLEEIGAVAFSDCGSLSARFGEMTNLVFIGQDAFKNRTGFTGNLVAPKLRKVDQTAFWNCRIHEFVAPYDLETISNRAFWACKNLTNVVFSAKIKAVDYSLFGGAADNKPGKYTAGLSVRWRAFPQNGLSDNINGDSESGRITHYITRDNADWINLRKPTRTSSCPRARRRARGRVEPSRSPFGTGVTLTVCRIRS